MSPRLKDKYLNDVVPALEKQLGTAYAMRVPKFTMIGVNTGVGEGAVDSKQVDAAMEELALITGQKPRLNRAKKSIAGFKIRQGMPVGASVTLRGDRMWEFLDRLIAVAIPRIRDFRGLSPKSFDGRGNYSFGVTEQLIFPEIDYDKVSNIRGMDITICTNAETNRDARALLDAFGFPFRRQDARV